MDLNFNSGMLTLDSEGYLWDALKNSIVSGSKMILKPVAFQRENDKIKIIYLIDMGCALGVHAGPGSLVTAIQPLS